MNRAWASSEVATGDRRENIPFGARSRLLRAQAQKHRYRRAAFKFRRRSTNRNFQQLNPSLDHLNFASDTSHNGLFLYYSKPFRFCRSHRGRSPDSPPSSQFTEHLPHSQLYEVNRSGVICFVVLIGL